MLLYERQRTFVHDLIHFVSASLSENDDYMYIFFICVFDVCEKFLDISIVFVLNFVSDHTFIHEVTEVMVKLNEHIHRVFIGLKVI